MYDDFEEKWNDEDIEEIDDEVIDEFQDEKVDGIFSSIEIEANIGMTKKRKKKISHRLINECAERYLKDPTDENFKDLWLRSYWGLRQHAHRIGIPNQFDIDDVVLNTYELILKKKDQYDASKGAFSTWMYTICTNECFAYWNRKKRDNLIDIDIREYRQSAKGAADVIDDYDYSDKFEINSANDIKLLERAEIKQKFFDVSVNVVMAFDDTRIRNCMLERLHYYRNSEEDKPLTLDQIAEKYDYPITSVKNWVNKGKIKLREAILEQHSDLFEMWKEVLE